MWITLLGLLLLATLTTLLGRLVSRVLCVRWLDRNHPDVLPLHAALGTAVLTCLCATSSHAGLSQTSAIIVVAAISIALLLWGARMQTLHPRTAPCRASQWLPLAVSVGGATVVGLIPIIWLHSFNPFNDAFYYNAVSDWLLDHGVSEIAPRDSMRPAVAIVSQFQEAGIRLGTSYVQAFLTAVTGASHAILLFYAVGCWGFILLGACLFSLGRRVFRLSPWLCAAAVCTMVCVPAGMTHALQAGFQAQPYGLSALVALLCITAAMLPRQNWTIGGCVVTASLLAWQTSVYSELLPVAGVALLAWLLITAVRAARRDAWRTWLGAIVWVAVAYVLLANFEIVRAAAAIPRQLGDVVGWHIDLAAAAWLGLFTGASTYPDVTGRASSLNLLALITGPILPMALCAVGLIRGSTRHLLLGTRAVFVVLGLLTAYYAFIARDPWSGDVFHTWSVFKLTEWLHPLIILGMWAGIGRFLRTPRAMKTAACVAVLVVLAGLPLHVRYARVLSFRAPSVFTGSDRPLTELARLSRNMKRLAGQQLYVVTRPHLTNPRFVELLGFFTNRSRAAGLWSGCTYIHLPWVTWTAPDKTDRVPQTDSLTLLCHQPHFRIQGARELGCGVAAVEASDEPVLCQVANDEGLLHTDGGEPFLWMGRQPTTLVIFAPHAGRVKLTFEAWLDPGATSKRRHLKITSAGVTEAATIDVGTPHDSQPSSLTFDVAAGVNEILLECTDDGDGSRLGANYPRTLMVAFSEPSLSFQ